MEIDQIGGEYAIVFEEPINTSSQIFEEDRNKVLNTEKEKTSYEEVKDKLKLANVEIDKLRKKVRMHAVERSNFERLKGLWELEKVSNSESISSQDQFFIWTIPAIKATKFISMVNTKLRANNRRIKRQVEDLQIQLAKPKDQPQQKSV